MLIKFLPINESNNLREFAQLGCMVFFCFVLHILYNKSSLHFTLFDCNGVKMHVLLSLNFIMSKYTLKKFLCNWCQSIWVLYLNLLVVHWFGLIVHVDKNSWIQFEIYLLVGDFIIIFIFVVNGMYPDYHNVFTFLLCSQLWNIHFDHNNVAI
jgi:hypothetical protein